MTSRFNPLKHHRRSTRLDGYDYSSPGIYFVTICTHQNREVLAALQGGICELKMCGRIAQNFRCALPDLYANVELDEWVIMPNHLHTILRLLETSEPTRPALGAIIGRWKYETTREINDLREQKWQNGRMQVWQRGFYDRIIRDERELEFVRQYIRDNPRNASAQP